MMAEPNIPRILYVDDEQGNRTVFKHSLTDVEVSLASSGTEALKLLSQHSFQVLVTDQRMPVMSGFELAQRCQQDFPDIPVVMITAYADQDLLLRALNTGVLFRFVEKPWNSDQLAQVIAEALAQHQKVSRTHAQIKRAQSSELRQREYVRKVVDARFQDIQNPQMQKVEQQIEKIAPTELSVIIYGETGTGKEITAKQIHAYSARSGNPFVAVNCATMSRELMLSDLFGHKKGAFTGAEQDRMGYVWLAEGGTLFLDEVAELSAEAQAALLRLIETGEFYPVGSDEMRKADCRFVAATHADLDQMVADGRFRNDLLWRLRQVSIELPPLRERSEDLQGLIQHCWHHIAQNGSQETHQLSESTMQTLMSYNWPGNIRELLFELERYSQTGEFGFLADHKLARSNLSEAVNQPYSDSCMPTASDLNNQLERLERQLLVDALKKAGGHPAGASRLLGIGRSNIYYRAKKLGIDLDQYRV